MFDGETNIIVVIMIGHMLHNGGKVQSNRNHHTAGTRGPGSMKNFVPRKTEVIYKLRLTDHDDRNAVLPKQMEEVRKVELKTTGFPLKYCSVMNLLLNSNNLSSAMGI